MSKKKGIITLVCVIAFLLAGTWTAVFGPVSYTHLTLPTTPYV